ncbi:glycoside hydrolase family 65 protein [Microbispora triticiradicis]|uniref:Glycoside hydrolase family 65 protein n=1 Tax=Microbispora triticiradicis TaxID=2200763 RepID=A0ABX9LI53_9ACTN|nr:glycosyl hydrolase family 65 protein [Microbispora triticiradicis]RGA03642.1 glycoside hydrolase family 65 protein [Microbispora triticiradicis]GLW26922.1 glycosyl hydrolase [Microbispora amethystogenes]
MIRHPAFTTEPWTVRECRLHTDVLAQTESVFALSNGHIGLRGNLDEGEPYGLPGTYLNSFYELRPLPYAEAGYGYPESGQTVVNVTNGKLIRLLVDDEPFDVRYGTLHSHERLLDLRAGTLIRTVRWSPPTGVEIRMRSTRLVSYTHRAVAAIRYEVEPVDQPVNVVVQSELVANETVPTAAADPRAAAALEAPLVLEENATGSDGMCVMVHSTRASRLRVAAAMCHEVDGPGGTRVDSDGGGDVSRVTVATRLRPGERLRLDKFFAYGWSAKRSRPAMHDQVVAALAAARLTGWDGLCAEQRAFLDDYWAGADVEVEGDAEVQQAVRFGLFHLLQAGARLERRPIPGKGLTGSGYDGHAFWDTESFVLPVATYTYPRAARDALEWRASILPLAEARAELLGLGGAAFPWRTINGEECSGYWPAGTAAFHVNADIADAVTRYVDATEDTAFEGDAGLPLLVATARLWCALGHHDAEGRYRIDGVTGPDEYSAVSDNNLYTNLMARRNLRAAAATAVRHLDRAGQLGVTLEEIAVWRDAAAAMYLPYDERLGVHAQSEGYTGHAVWDFENTRPDQYPLLLHFPYFDLYRKQVVKQADLVLAMHLCGEAFTPEQKARNFAYYEALTVRDSSLSAATQAVLAAEVGQLGLAYAYLGEAALIDLRDLQHNTRDGVHMASLAGAWIALVSGFGGLRAGEGRLCFAPRLPSEITRLTFRVRYRGRLLRVDVTSEDTTYRLLHGSPVSLAHHGETLTLGGRPQSRSNPSPPFPELRITQPPGREPPSRRPAIP